MGASGVGSKVWVLTLGVLEVNPELDSKQDGLWRPGGAFFQIGLGCVMSHHQSPHRRALFFSTRPAANTTSYLYILEYTGVLMVFHRLGKPSALWTSVGHV